MEEPKLPSVLTNSSDAPVRQIKSDELKALGLHLSNMFNQYVADRRIAELRWIQNLRQYLGFYDPEIEKLLTPNKSRAYPKITRIKCISTLARIMDLMFPGNERNWSIKASPSADLDPSEAMIAVQEALERDQQAGIQPNVNDAYLQNAIQTLADKKADTLATLLVDLLRVYRA